MRRGRTSRAIGLSLLVLATATGTASAQQLSDQGSSSGAAATAEADSDLTIEFERYTLDNGMEVILHQDSSAPLVAVDVWYHVGSGDEVPNQVVERELVT